MRWVAHDQNFRPGTCGTEDDGERLGVIVRNLNSAVTENHCEFGSS